METIPFTPTKKQLAAQEMILDWLASPSKQTFHLGGYAGTGKTTILKTLLDRISVPYAVTSFTGKAVSVLRRKGIQDAQTMHSYLYDPQEEKDGTVTFVKKFSFEEELIVNDESSMVSTDLNNDLLSTGAKILYVGDPGQLEPVGDNPNLMLRCDIVLDEIHRQAANSPILTLATKVRGGSKIEHYDEETETSSVSVISKELALSKADEVDQVICGLNATRNQINEILRNHLSRKGLLVEGEKVICLRNDKKKGIFNGMILKVTKIKHEFSDCFVCNLEDDLGVKIVGIKLNKLCLREGQWKESNGRIPFGHALFAYGYCITCHKSQGSEWDSVLVFDQSRSPLWSASRWQYTAITRAAKRLIYGI